MCGYGSSHKRQIIIFSSNSVASGRGCRKNCNRSYFCQAVILTLPCSSFEGYLWALVKLQAHGICHWNLSLDEGYSGSLCLSGLCGLVLLIAVHLLWVDVLLTATTCSSLPFIWKKKSNTDTRSLQGF